jgi:signal transduction histidine kinase
MMLYDETEPRLLAALASLNQIGAAINRLVSGDQASLSATLRWIAESASQVVSGASAVIYTYDPAQALFDPTSRVSAGEMSAPLPDDEPRPDGLGARAIRQRRCVLSYEEADLEIHEVKQRAGARVVACCPLVVANRPQGVLYIYLRESRRFSQLELLMLDNFVNQAGMAIGAGQAQQLMRVQRDLTRAEDELERLRRADLLISSRLNLRETLEAILHMALEVTSARYGIFRLVDKTGRQLVNAAVAGEGLRQPAIEALPINTTSIMGWVAKHRQPLCITDLQANPWARIYYPLDHGVAMRSELAVPLIGASGRLEGVLNLESPQVGAFSEQDSHLLQALATQAVIAIQEVRLLDALQEIAEQLLSQPPQAVFDHLVELACDLLNTPVGNIWVLDAAADNLVLQAANGGYRRGERISVQDSLTGEAILRCQPVATDDVRGDPRFQRRELAVAERWGGALVVPLLAGAAAKPVGAFTVISSETDTRRFADSEWDKKVLTCLAHHAALAVQEASRRAALQAAQEQRAVAETFAAVGDIAANLLHRVNNKVGTIPVRVEGIQDKCAAAVQADPYLAANLEEIERSANEAMTVMRESLFHLRPITMTAVPVASSVAEAVAASGLPPTVRVCVEGLDELPLVMAGAQRLVLVFANLLENAAAAMEGQGVITIRGAMRGDRVEITVSDTGPGISPALHERIFEFDFSGRKAHAGKLGFGLWWVRTLMTRFGGSVTVDSDGQHGATFMLRLPRAE